MKCADMIAHHAMSCLEQLRKMKGSQPPLEEGDSGGLQVVSNDFNISSLIVTLPLASWCLAKKDTAGGTAGAPAGGGFSLGGGTTSSHSLTSP